MMVTFKKDALLNVFLIKPKQAAGNGDDTDTVDEILAGMSVGGALGSGLGAVLPYFLTSLKGRVPGPLMSRPFMTRVGLLAGTAAGSLIGRWLPEVFEIGRQGFREGTNSFSNSKNRKQADETLKGVGTGALVGAGVSAGATLPVLFGRLGRRLPTKILNRMLIGRALAGAAIGGAVGGVVSRSNPKDNVSHYWYHGTKGGGK